MKNTIITRILSLTGAIIIIGCLTGCKDMFVNPLKDKDTGESVTMLIIDRNFIKTKFYVHLVDYNTGEEVTSEPIEIGFFGPDSVNLVSFTGEKKANYTTSSAFIEVGYDPNVEISRANPIEFRVVAMSDNYVSVPQEFRYTTEGTKDLVIQLVKTGLVGPVLKAAFDEPFDLKFNGELKSPSLKLSAQTVNSFMGHTRNVNYYKSLVSGRLTASNLKDSIQYSEYGFCATWLDKSSRKVSNIMDSKDLEIPSKALVMPWVQWTGMLMCNNGLKIHVDGPAGGSGTLNYRISFGELGLFNKEGKISCVFPSDQLIEPVYYYSYLGSSGFITYSVTLSGDAQYNISNSVSLNDLCDATATFTATPKSNLSTYKFVTLYTCPESSVGMGLSIRGQFRKVLTSGAWTDFSFIGGVCQLLLEQGSDYDFRVNIDGKYYNYTLPTDPAHIEDALRNLQNTDFKIKTLAITLADLPVTVNAEVQFSAAVCELIK